MKAVPYLIGDMFGKGVYVIPRGRSPEGIPSLRVERNPPCPEDIPP